MAKVLAIAAEDFRDEVVVAVGAEIAGTGVARRQNLLTASGPRKAEEFAEKFCGMLE